MADLTTERVQFEASLANLLGTYGSGEPVVIPTSRMTLINYTKAKLDEIIPEGEGTQFALDANNNITDPYTLFVNAMLDEAAKRVILLAPSHVLTATLSTATATADPSDNKIGYIALPLNFLRAISLKMTDWKREVREFILPSDKRYKAQQNKYIRGGVNKPVAALTHRKVDGAAKRVIEYYSVNSSHVIDYFFYVPETAAEDLQSNLQDALTWTLSGMILQITSRADLAKNALEQANVCLQNL